MKNFQNPQIASANINAIRQDGNYGENTEIFNTRFKISSSKLKPGTYRSITGNSAAAIALIAASQKLTPLFRFISDYSCI